MPTKRRHHPGVHPRLALAVDPPGQAGRKIVDGRQERALVEHLTQLEPSLAAGRDQEPAGDEKELTIGRAALRRRGEHQQRPGHSWERELEAPVLRDARSEEPRQGPREPAGVFVGGPLRVATHRQEHALDGAHDRWSRRPPGRLARGRSGESATCLRARWGLELSLRVRREGTLERDAGGRRAYAALLCETQIARDHLVAETLHEGSDELPRGTGHQRHPEPGQPRRKERDRQHQPPHAEGLRRHHHELAVRQDLGGADVVRLPLARSPTDDVFEERDDIVERDRLRAGLHPFRADHDRQTPRQLGEHVVGRAAAPEDEPRAQDGDRHALRAERFLDLAATLQVRGQRAVRDQPAQVDDLAHPAALGRAREVVGAEEIEVRKISLREARRGRHAVHEVESDVSAGQARLRLPEIEEIGRAEFGKFPAILRHPTGHADDVAARAQPRRDRSPDEAAGSRDGDAEAGWRRLWQRVGVLAARCGSVYALGQVEVHGGTIGASDNPG